MIACVACTWTSSQVESAGATAAISFRHSAETGHAVRVVPYAAELSGPRPVR